MRLVTGGARLGFHGRMLEDERPALVGVTLEAARLVRIHRPQYAAGEDAAVRVVAIYAGHRALGDAMLEGALETRPHIDVALGALRVDFGWLAGDETVRAILVDRVARGAAHLITGMTAIDAADVRRLIQMAGETAFVGGGGLELRRLDNIGGAHGFGVLAARTVAGLARVVLA